VKIPLNVVLTLFFSHAILYVLPLSPIRYSYKVDLAAADPNAMSSPRVGKPKIDRPAGQASSLSSSSSSSFFYLAFLVPLGAFAYLYASLPTMKLSQVFLSASNVLALGFGNDWEISNGQTRLLGSSYAVPGVDAVYDYLVIGGGNSGLTVAKRLAEHPDLSVAVVEAGGYYQTDSGNQSQIPAYNAYYDSAPATIDWGIYTTPQSQLNGRSIHYAQGKCLGGGTGRNAMAYQRGTKGSYDEWASQVGDQSWSFDSVLPYFQKSCNFTPPNYTKRGGPAIKVDPSAFSVSGGPLKISYWGYYLPVSAYFRQALDKLGFKENDAGILAGSLLGYAQYPSTLDPDAMVRDSSQTSFGQAAIQETTLQYYIRTLAKKIIFDGKTATGVQVTTAGKTYTLHARKEVILAAGALRSPQLLMVSGVGPQAELQKLNIPVVSNLPGVGQNLIDQPGFGIIFPVNVTTQHSLFSNATYAAEAVESFNNDRTGPLTLFGSNYILWEKLPNASLANIGSAGRNQLEKYPADWPDLQYIFNMQGEANNDTRNQASVVVTLQKPSSVGSITINSTDTEDNPIVDAAWLRSELDQRIGIESIRRARTFAQASDIVNGPEILPGDNVQSDADILAYLQNTTATSHHAVATCKMGKSSDPNAVADSNGKVLGGISGLRIVDTSVWPLLPPGQPMATAYMVAEKLAAVILKGN
jgi:choline dehydrogenase